MYVKKSIPRAKGNPGLAINPRDQLTLLDVEDIAYMPSPDENGVVIAEDIIMKQGRYGIGIYMTPGTVSATSAAEGDTDKVGFTPQIVFDHPGNDQDVREFKTNFISRKVIAIMRYCSGKPADLIGSLCNPCTVTPSYTGDSEGNTNNFTIAQANKGDDMFIYKGTVPLEEPVALVDASADKVEFVADGQYQLQSGAATINKIEGGSHGALVTLLGTKGDAPTVSSGNSILLKGGKTFVASEGSQLTLRAFDKGEGELLWIEQSRYEI